MQAGASGTALRRGARAPVLEVYRCAHCGYDDWGLCHSPWIKDRIAMSSAAEPSLLAQGLELTLFGMGTVLVFLSLLVFALHAMSTLVKRYLSEGAPMAAADAAHTSSSASAPDAAVDARLKAVAVAAVHRHRARQPAG